MKEKIRKTISKQIICIITATMLCNFMVPNFVYAADTDGGGDLFADVAKLICFVPDVVIEFLQNQFVSPGSIRVTNELYQIMYGPGTIFSGEIPAFDIDFIGEAKSAKKGSNVISGVGTEWVLTNEEINENYKDHYETAVDIVKNLSNNGVIVKNSNTTVRLHGESFSSVREIDRNGTISLEEILNKFNIKWTSESTYTVENIGKFDEKDYKNQILKEEGNGISVKLENVEYYGALCEYINLTWEIHEGTAMDDTNKSGFDIVGQYGYFSGKWKNGNELDLHEYNDVKVTVTIDEYEDTRGKYTSAILQPIVSTWYNTFRRIALVGLLSVLVYMGIRILLKSTSAKDKAKYKHMLSDWLIAICILFTLHYIMNITITVVEKINEVIGVSTVGQEGEDVLLSEVRTKIANGNDFGEVIVEEILYCVLVVYAVIFSIQYIRRVIYLAFLTMIAPLIALTYPLDKIKDKKAQAFDMWIKDYVFFTLLQVIHLLIYYILVGTSITLQNEGNWIFAIVALEFMTKAEKIVKEMFGFNKSKTMGALAAGATGALVSNGLTKLKGFSFGGKKGNGPSEKSGEGTSGKVRTATNNPMGGAKNGADKNSSRSGAEALIRKYGKTAMGGAIGVGTGIAGGIIGAAAGIAQGDVTTALTGAAAGASAGNSLGKGAVDGIVNTVDGVKNTARDVKDTYRAGKYGEETAQAMRFDEDFRKGSTYKALQSNSNFSDASVQAMLDEGISDKKEMTKILDSLDSGIGIDEAIKYNKLAKDCPDTVYYNDNILKNFWKSKMNIEEDADTIRDILSDFK